MDEGDESTGGGPIRPTYTLLERVDYLVKSNFNKERKLLLEHYDDILEYAARQYKQLAYMIIDRNDRKDWGGMHGYPNFEKIEKIFRLPKEELPLNMNHFGGTFEGHVVNWRMKNNI